MENIEFAEKLNEFILNGYSLKNRQDYFSCGNSNDILEKCGLNPKLDIIITQSGMKKILGKRKDKIDEAHDLTPIEASLIPELLKKPILIIEGNTSDTRLIFIQILRAERKMFAVIELDKTMLLPTARKYNLVASVYSQEIKKVAEKIIIAESKNAIWYYDSEQIKSWLSVNGQLQLLPIIKANSMFSEKDFVNANIDKKSNLSIVDCKNFGFLMF